jgi:hypothetical protein
MFYRLRTLAGSVLITAALALAAAVPASGAHSGPQPGQLLLYGGSYFEGPARAVPAPDGCTRVFPTFSTGSTANRSVYKVHLYRNATCSGQGEAHLSPFEQAADLGGRVPVASIKFESIW